MTIRLTNTAESIGYGHRSRSFTACFCDLSNMSFVFNSISDRSRGAFTERSRSRAFTVVGYLKFGRVIVRRILKGCFLDSVDCSRYKVRACISLIPMPLLAESGVFGVRPNTSLFRVR